MSDNLKVNYNNYLNDTPLFKKMTSKMNFIRRGFSWQWNFFRKVCVIGGGIYKK